MRNVKDAMETIQKLNSDGEIPIDDGSTCMDTETRPPEVDIISVGDSDEHCDESHVSIPKSNPAIDRKKVSEVMALLQGARDQKVIKPKIGPSHQQEELTTSVNPHVLPPYVSWLKFIVHMKSQLGVHFLTGYITCCCLFFHVE